jgi:hypothetical protein
MRPPHFVALLPLLMLTAVPTAVRAQDVQTATLSTVQKASHAYAVQSFREQRYAAAYGRFAQLADAGHVPSAQMALVMYGNGPTLFGSHWSAAPDQQRRWNTLVINSARSRIDFADNERAD